MASDRSISVPTDGEKLRLLADWLDRLDRVFDNEANPEVQVDLRRMADRLDEIEHVADRLSIIMSMSAYKDMSDPPEFDFDVVLDQLELHLRLLSDQRRHMLKDCDCVL